jgi:cellulose synthase/poly-beta-1,6-N-acetylglucosamine synthase-like glycosyltransferase
MPILQLAMFVTYILAIGRLLSKASRGAISDSVCASLSRPWLAVIAYYLALSGLSAIVWQMASSGSLKGATVWMFLAQYYWILPLISSLLMLALAVRLARHEKSPSRVEDRFIEG